MLSTLSHVAFTTYFIGLAGLLVSFSLEAARYVLRARDRRTAVPQASPGAGWPPVTIQLPICNDGAVVDRVIDGCCRLDYPSDRLEIQVLDDSTDEATTAIVARAVAVWTGRGTSIVHIRRPARTGFKAGNLQHGLRSARGEFVALFDADFVPDRDFLKKILPHFHDAAVGVVQPATRHLNRNQSVLTVAQDPFGAMPRGRSGGYDAGHFINTFSGSPGLLRRACLIDIGGWEGDTLAEDEDLSIRAYLKGWRCIRLHEPMASDELQARMSDFKVRLARCNHGPVQCFLKHATAIVSSGTLGAARKMSLLPTLFCAWLSLLSVALVAVSSVPLIVWHPASAFQRACLLIPSILAIGAVACVAFWRRTLAATIGLYVGTCFRGGLSTLRAFAGATLPFHPTPKRGSAGHVAPLSLWPGSLRAARAGAFEGALAVYFLAALFLSAQVGHYWFVPVHALCFLSCAFVFALTASEPC